MPVRVNIEGTILLPEEARISAFDRGFLFGDSIYETCRTYGGRPFLLKGHLARLRRSAAGIGLTDLPSDDHVSAEVARTVEAAGNPESRVRIVLTRGDGDGFGLLTETTGGSRMLIYVQPLSVPAPEVRAEGVDVIVPSLRQTSPATLPGWIKSSNRLLQISALQEGRAKGAYEVVLLDEAGFVAEGSTSNVFFMRGEVLCTPALSVGILPGLTRALVLGLAEQAGVPTKEGRFRPADLMGAEEVFLTGSSIELLPVRRAEGQPIAHCPGPVTRALHDSYRLLTHRFIQGEVGEEDLLALIGDGEGQEG